MSALRILLAVEDEAISLSCEDFIGILRLDAGTAILVFHAIDPEEAVASWPGEYSNNARRLVGLVAQRVRARFPQVMVEEQIAEGYARETIVKVASQWQADLIVLASHGREGMARLVLGSVSQAIPAAAPCPVAIIMPSRKDKDTHAGRNASIQLDRGPLRGKAANGSAAQPADGKDWTGPRTFLGG